MARLLVTSPSLKVAVTGATGNAGVRVVEALLAAGANVVALGGSLPKNTAALPASVEPRLFNFRQPATWAGAVAGCQSVFLLRPPAIGDVEATLIPFAQKALQEGATHIVFLSVAGAETNRLLPHHKVEVFLKTTAGYTILRPGFFAQNLQDAYKRDIVDQSRIYVPAGRGRVAFVDLYDVAQVAAAALLDPASHLGQGYTLTGPVAVTFAEVAAELSQHLNRRVTYEAASIMGYLRHLRRRKLPWMQSMVQTVLHVGLRFGQAATVDPTLGRLLKRPPRTVSQYIAEHADIWRWPNAPLRDEGDRYSCVLRARNNVSET